MYAQWALSIVIEYIWIWKFDSSFVCGLIWKLNKMFCVTHVSIEMSWLKSNWLKSVQLTTSFFMRVKSIELNLICSTSFACKSIKKVLHSTCYFENLRKKTRISRNHVILKATTFAYWCLAFKIHNHLTFLLAFLCHFFNEREKYNECVKWIDYGFKSWQLKKCCKPFY